MRFIVFLIILMTSANAYARTWVSPKHGVEVTVPDTWKVTSTVNGVGLEVGEGLFFGLSQVLPDQVERQLKQLGKDGATIKDVKFGGLKGKRVTTKPKDGSTIDYVGLTLDHDSSLMLMFVGKSTSHASHRKEIRAVLKSIRKTRKSTVAVGTGFGDFWTAGKAQKLKGSKFTIFIPPSFEVENRKNGFVGSGPTVIVDYACTKPSSKGAAPVSTFEHKVGKKILKGRSESQGEGLGRRQSIQIFVAPKKGCTLELLSAGVPSARSHELAREIMRTIR